MTNIEVVVRFSAVRNVCLEPPPLPISHLPSPLVYSCRAIFTRLKKKKNEIKQTQPLSSRSDGKMLQHLLNNLLPNFAQSLISYPWFDINILDNMVKTPLDPMKNYSILGTHGAVKIGS